MTKRIRYIFVALFILTVLSMIAAFGYALWTPPPGDVPEGTLKALGIFLALAVFTEVPFIFEVARSFRIEKGDFAAEVRGKGAEDEKH